MGVVAGMKWSLSVELSTLLVFSIGPGAATSMAYQSAEPMAEFNPDKTWNPVPE